MAMGQGLYAQVVVILRRESDDKRGKKTNKCNFQGQSARSRRWCNLDHDWLEETFRKCVPDFY